MTTDPSAAQWFKSSRSATNKECVEIAWLDAGKVGVRDSKNPTGPALVFTRGEWGAFVHGAKATSAAHKNSNHDSTRPRRSAGVYLFPDN